MALSNDKLTDKQEMFCQEYLRLFNASQAYINAYDATYRSAAREGSKALKNPKIIKRINKLKEETKHDLFFEPDRLLKYLFKLAFVDISNYISKTEDGKILVKNLDNVDTSLIESLKETNNGIELKLKDSKWAMDYLAKHFDLFPDKWKRKIEEEKLKLLKIKTMGDVGEVDEGKLSAWMAGLDDETIKSNSIEELERMYHESIGEE